MDFVSAGCVVPSPTLTQERIEDGEEEPGMRGRRDNTSSQASSRQHCQEALDDPSNPQFRDGDPGMDTLGSFPQTDKLNTMFSMSGTIGSDTEGQALVDTKTKFRGKRIRTCMLRQGDIYNQRRQEQQALCHALADHHGTVPPQLWYDSLRETDDGRFSQHLLQDKVRVRQEQEEGRQNAYMRARNVASEMSEDVRNTFAGLSRAGVDFEEFAEKTSLTELYGNAKSQVQRPFNSSSRLHFTPYRAVGGPSELFVRKKLYPPHDRQGGMSGQEEFDGRKRAPTDEAVQSTQEAQNALNATAETAASLPQRAPGVNIANTANTNLAQRLLDKRKSKL